MSRENRATRRTLVLAVPSLHPQPIESPSTGTGIADLWLTTCAIECKCLRKWPAREKTTVKLKHELTSLQFKWLNDRYRDGYPTWVMLQARRLEWLLFAAPDARVLTSGNEVTRAQLYRDAAKVWRNRLDNAELLKWLSMTQPQMEAWRNDGLVPWEQNL